MTSSNVRVSIYGSKTLAAVNRSVPDPANPVFQFLEGVFTDLSSAAMPDVQSFGANDMPNPFRLTVNLSYTDFKKIRTGMFISLDQIKHPDTKSFIAADEPKEQFIIKHVSRVHTASRSVVMTLTRLPGA